jgi:methyltransferase-like protein
VEHLIQANKRGITRGDFKVVRDFFLKELKVPGYISELENKMEFSTNPGIPDCISTTSIYTKVA